MRGILKMAVALVLAGLTLSTSLRAEPVTILALGGDSLTHGYGLPAEDGFVPQMQAWLTAQGADVAVINAGVSGGDTTAGGGAARLGWSLTDEVDAVIVALGGNDILRGGIPAEVARQNLAAILDQLAARDLPVLLVGQKATGNFGGAAYQQSFDAIYPVLAAQYGTALFPDFLAGGLNLLEDRDAVVATYLQGDGLHPNAAGGVKLVVAAMGGPAVLELVAQAQAH